MRNIWEPLEIEITNLIAFSILCQGFLASHGGDGLDHAWQEIPDEMKRKCLQNKESTEKPSWWAPIKANQLLEEIEILFDNTNVKDSFISLILIDKENNKIKKIDDVKKAYKICSELFT